MRRRISKERVAQDIIITAAIPKAPTANEAQVIVLGRDGTEITASRNGNEVARGDSYAHVLGLINRRSDKMVILEVHDGVIGFEHSAAVMQRYGLRSIRFEPIVPAERLAA
ncbi:hypothetical protein GCM10025867_47810 (plasmid) [Frondihabitans sucicola]|uniref:Uncharacterized protein n=1 Tax=Frondihabitans sucicola TaxID=1268041 RepID=A0ABN6Y5C9_9MICO|nr:hypothetical protein [Frondihabitans sucicola]BDZ52540.1 hypothetical protein GCM10025867_47810 [Frondihabitans sucicola]